MSKTLTPEEWFLENFPPDVFPNDYVDLEIPKWNNCFVNDYVNYVRESEGWIKKEDIKWPETMPLENGDNFDNGYSHGFNDSISETKKLNGL